MLTHAPLLPAVSLLAQASSDESAFFLIFQLVVIVVVVASFWKVFAKAGQPGWAAIIPFYNLYILCKIAGRPGWWLLLMFIPLLNIVIFAIISIDVAKSFGRSSAFGLGLWLLGFIFYPILAFGSSEYQGPAAA